MERMHVVVIMIVIMVMVRMVVVPEHQAIGANHARHELHA